MIIYCVVFQFDSYTSDRINNAIFPVSANNSAMTVNVGNVIKIKRCIHFIIGVKNTPFILFLYRYETALLIIKFVSDTIEFYFRNLISIVGYNAIFLIMLHNFTI